MDFNLLDSIKDAGLFIAGIAKQHPRTIKGIGGRVIDVTTIIVVGYFVLVRAPLQDMTDDVRDVKAIAQTMRAEFTEYRIAHEKDHTQLEREHTAIERSIRRRSDRGQ